VIIFVVFALLFVAFGWYTPAAIAFTLGIMLEYFASKYPPGDDSNDD
jgi:uncharacterized membrane protein